jgi:hypothetical protein
LAVARVRVFAGGEDAHGWSNGVVE